MANDMDFALSMFNNAMDLTTQMAASDLNYRQSRKLMAYQTELNRENWNLQNAYNEEIYNKYSSPSAMVKQYKDAGLNPAALAGGSSAQVAEADISGSSLGSAAPAHPNFNILSGMAQMAQIRHIEAQTKNLDVNTLKTQQETDQGAQMFPLLMDAQKLQNGLTRAETALANSRAFNEQARTAWQNIQNEIAAATKDNQIQMSREQLDTMIANLRIVRAQAFEAEKRNEHLDEVIKAELSNLSAQALLARSNAALVDANAKLSGEQFLTQQKITAIKDFERQMLDKDNYLHSLLWEYDTMPNEDGIAPALEHHKEQIKMEMAEFMRQQKVTDWNDGNWVIWWQTFFGTVGQVFGPAATIVASKGKKVS